MPSNDVGSVKIPFRIRKKPTSHTNYTRDGREILHHLAYMISKIMCLHNHYLTKRDECLQQVLRSVLDWGFPQYVHDKLESILFKSCVVTRQAVKTISHAFRHLKQQIEGLAREYAEVNGIHIAESNTNPTAGLELLHRGHVPEDQREIFRQAMSLDPFYNTLTRAINDLHHGTTEIRLRTQALIDEHVGLQDSVHVVSLGIDLMIQAYPLEAEYVNTHGFHLFYYPNVAARRAGAMNPSAEPAQPNTSSSGLAQQNTTTPSPFSASGQPANAQHRPTTKVFSQPAFTLG